MSWLNRILPPKIKRDNESDRKPSPIPEGVWTKCPGCEEALFQEELRLSLQVCPKCGYHHRIGARARLFAFLDQEGREEIGSQVLSEDPLEFVDSKPYPKRVADYTAKSGETDALIVMSGTVRQQPMVAAAFEFAFMGGSMGSVVGERFRLGVEEAIRRQCPFVCFAASGGARMQEGLFSLMQMAKTSAALKRHHEAGQLYVSVLTDPTTGGVTASFAMLGDIILAEPGALIGFAGPRVIEQTIGQKLPEGFQRAEFLVEHGFVDKIVKREELKETLAMILKLHKKPESGCLADWKTENTVDRAAFEEKEQNSSAKRAHHGSGKAAGAIRSAWDSVLLSRKADRPVATDYIRAIFDDFMEFHGDRYCKDDGAIVGGIASFHGMPVTVIGQEKGKNTKDNIKRNFGMPSPDGYRKALRLMKQAETFGRPVVCFVDTPGAFCGLEAEERGQGEAIARNLFEMSDLTVPVLSIVIGEGGSGGALAMAVANEVWMMENAVYSVLSPEGFASILWKDSKRADEAARVMKMTAAELKELGIIERVIPEPEPADPETLPEIAKTMENAMEEFFEAWTQLDGKTLAERRYERFRKF